MKCTCLSLLVASLIGVNSPGQTVIVNDNFDGYSNSAALHAVWAGLGGSASPGTPAEVEPQFPLFDLVSLNADFNGNTTVDAADYTIWRNNLNTGTSQSQGDANGDSLVNATDFGFWKSTFGTKPTVGSSGKAVRHLKNTTVAANRVPDGNLVYQPPLDPNFFPDNSIFPSDGLEPIVLRGDIYAEDSNLQRNTIGLRSFFDGASANLIEMGFNNGTGSQVADAASHPEWGAAVGATADCVAAPSQACVGFGTRLQLFTSAPGINPDWQFFKFDAAWDTNGNGLVSEAEVFAHVGGPAWHRFEVTITADPAGDHHDVVFTLDLLRDGMNNATGLPGVDATITYNDLVTVSQEGFNSLRLGGPSGLYTTSAVQFDNIYLSGPLVTPGAGAAVPEPSSIAALIALIGILSGVRSRWHSV